jgi:hypothetical protein
VHPVPTDARAEVEVVSAILDGTVTMSDLPGLQARHFAHPMHRVIIEVAPTIPRDIDGGLSLEAVENVLRNRGFRGPLMQWLEDRRDVVPFAGRESVLAAATRVREMWRSRRLLERLEHVCLALRTGTTVDNAFEEIRRISTKTSGPTKVKAVA